MNALKSIFGEAIRAREVVIMLIAAILLVIACLGGAMPQHKQAVPTIPEGYIARIVINGDWAEKETILLIPTDAIFRVETTKDTTIYSEKICTKCQAVTKTSSGCRKDQKGK